ncbi:MAG: hypothetical protein LBS23_03250, partial [Holosporaceae bacterium]|nr:hypothetical protein [Holosporaceae bacterium]
MQNKYNEQTPFGFNFKNLDLFQFAVLNPQIAMLSFLKIGKELATQPKQIERSRQNLLDRLLELQKSFISELGHKDESSIELKYNEKNKKFEKDIFENNAVMLFARRFYETMSSWMLDTLDNIENIDSKTMHSARFFMKQYIDM